jgi:hypothetical protein
MHARLMLHLYVHDCAIIIVHDCAIIIVHNYAIIIDPIVYVLELIVFVLGLIVYVLGLIVYVHYTLYFNLNSNQYFVDFIVLALTHC